jgi:hypothetical protein
MTEQPVVRLHLYFARDVPKAVILRQGPTRQFRMILWDRRDDSFEDGQWTKQKVYPERCAVSPDARHFLYFMLDGQWGSEAEGAYTALSRPPWWTALALFPEGSTWGGGGAFLDAVHYLADGGPDIVGRDAGLVRVRRGEVTKDCASGLRLPSGKPVPLSTEVRARLAGLPVPAPNHALRDALGAEDHPLDRYDTQGGRLYRREGGEMALIRDFTDMTFEPVRATYGWRDEAAGATPEPWHPLDRDDAP